MEQLGEQDVARDARPAVQRQERFPALDGMRAIAVLLVFTLHALPYSASIRDHVSSWRDHLDLGVEIFFVLSGFLVYRPFAASHIANRSSPSLSDYSRRRLLRIYPAYIVALTVLTIVEHGTVNGVRGYIAAVGLMHWYVPYAAGLGLGQSWTLVAEITFYALIPVWALLVRAAGRRVGARRAEVGCAVIWITAGLVLREIYRYHPVTRLNPMSLAMPTLGFGMLLTILSLRAAQEPRLEQRLVRATRFTAVWWVVAGVLYAWLARLPLNENAPTDRLRQDLVQALIAALVVTPCVFRDWREGPILRALTLRPLIYVATISYGIYLWHPAMLHLIGPERFDSHGLASGVALMPVALGLTIAVGALSWHLLERPVMRWARRPQRTLAASRPPGSTRSSA